MKKEKTRTVAIMILAIYIAIIGQVSAQNAILTLEREYTCLDNWTLNTSIHMVTSYDGVTNVTEIIQDLVDCPHGCVDNATIFGDDCRTVIGNSAMGIYMALAIMGVIIVVLWYISSATGIVASVMTMGASIMVMQNINLPAGMGVFLVAIVMLIFSADDQIKASGSGARRG